MERKRLRLVLVVVVALAAVVFFWTQRSDPPIVFAQGQMNHFAMTPGTYRFAGNQTELSTIVLLDQQSGKTWFLSVQTTNTNGQPVNSVKWVPIN
jgi:hypothetical protein